METETFFQTFMQNGFSVVVAAFLLLRMEKELRLLRAKELLSTTDMSIKEIAYQLNFESPDYFSAKFKSKTGHRPSELRGQ